MQGIYNNIPFIYKLLIRVILFFSALINSLKEVWEEIEKAEEEHQKVVESMSQKERDTYWLIKFLAK